MSNKLQEEYWAMKDTEKNIFVSSKFGRSLWKRKPHPNTTIFIGYRKSEGGSSQLKPVKVLVTELD